MPPRSHIARNTPSHILYFVLQGVLPLRVNGEEICLRPGDAYIFSKDDRQEPLDLADVSYYYVHFQFEGNAQDFSDDQYICAVKDKNMAYARANNRGVSGYDDLRVFVRQRTHIEDRALTEQLCSLFERCTNLFWSKNPENRYWISAIFARILLKIESSSISREAEHASPKQWIYSMVIATSDYLSCHFADPIGRKEIEKCFSVNYDYLNRNFHRLMGKSIVQYRNALRIERSKILLETTQKDIMEIAEETGFKDKYYFGRLFKKMTGISPTTYRKVLYEKDI